MGVSRISWIFVLPCSGGKDVSEHILCVAAEHFTSIRIHRPLVPETLGAEVKRSSQIKVSRLLHTE